MEWTWISPGNEWFVQTDKKKGIIKVYEKGKVIFERKDLSSAVVNMIEENFFKVVAKEIKTVDGTRDGVKKLKKTDDMMYA